MAAKVDDSIIHFIAIREGAAMATKSEREDYQVHDQISPVSLNFKSKSVQIRYLRLSEFRIFEKRTAR